MSVAEIIDEEVMNHLSNFGCVRNLDPMALHLLKTSEHPLMRFRRNWMRATALRQAREATRRQTKINEEFAREKVRRGASLRRAAVIDPWFAQEMKIRHSTTWNDREFVGSVRRDNPTIFPRREYD